jgi:hypothetical protein
MRKLKEEGLAHQATPLIAILPTYKAPRARRKHYPVIQRPVTDMASALPEALRLARAAATAGHRHEHMPRGWKSWFTVSNGAAVPSDCQIASNRDPFSLPTMTPLQRGNPGCEALLIRMGCAATRAA